MNNTLCSSTSFLYVSLQRIDDTQSSDKYILQSSFYILVALGKFVTTERETEVVGFFINETYVGEVEIMVVYEIEKRSLFCPRW